MRPLSVFLVCAALVATVALSGCLNNQTVAGPQYSNDVVTIENYYISNLNPYAGSETQVDFTLQNNGENPVSRVTLDVNPASGMQVVSLLCQGTTSYDTSSGKRCVFDASNSFTALQSIDLRSVSIRLQTPSQDIITKPTPFAVSYSVKYDYSGYRTANLPVVDGTTLLKATSAYSQSAASFSPIRLDFQLAARAQHKDGDTVVNEYWGVKDEPFEVTFSLTDVASGKYKAANPIIPAGGIVLDAKGSLQEATGLPCDFCKGGTNDGTKDCPGTNPDWLYLSNDVKVPGKLRCSFTTTPFAEPQTLATLVASYTFSYAYAKTDAFSVQPVS